MKIIFCLLGVLLLSGCYEEDESRGMSAYEKAQARDLCESLGLYPKDIMTLGRGYYVECFVED